jgi:O-antigen/teichoic acid export membrane protein
VSRIYRAVAFSAVERYGTMVIYIVYAAALSRLLAPEEFGLYALVFSCITIVSAPFQEVGGANYLIQKRVLSEGDIRSAFTITLGLSLAVGFVMLELRDVIARAFSNAELGHAFAVASLNFILTPFATTLSALFRRDLEFRTLAICNLAGTLVIALVSLALAMLGFSFMAPIWGMLAGNAVSVVLMMTARRNFRNFLPAISGYTDVVSFGAYSGAISALSVFYNLAPQVFLGRNLGFTPVGLYNRALNAAQMFDKFIAQVVAPVIMPAIVAKAEAGKSLKLLYLEAIEILSVVQWPFLLWVALLAPSIIRIWLGPAWLDVVPLVRLLCIAQLALFGGYLTYPVLVAAGSVRDALIAALISLPPSLAMSFGASFFGAQALAASALVSLPLQAAVAIHFVTKRLAIGPAELFSAMAKSVVVTFSTSIGVLTCAVLVNARLIPSLAAILLSISLGAIGWWIGMVLTGHPLLVRLENASRNLPFRIPKSLFQIP